MAISATIVVGLTGHSGAQLAWEGKLSNPPADTVAPVVAESDPPTASAQAIPTESAETTSTAAPAEPVVEIILGEWTLITSVDEIPPGPTTFRVRNAGTHVHAFRIRTPGSGGDRSEWRSDPVGPGETITFVAELPEGTLELTCPVEDGAGDHDDLGMQAPLTVRAGAPPPVPSMPPTTPTPAPGSTAASADASNVTLDISAFAYTPADVTVPVGTIVTWTNNDPVPHTATGEGFDSGTLSTGDTGSVTFTAPGVYAYFCSIHPSMTGRIEVSG